jgi:uncharacterized protein (DUF362 family)
MSGHCLTRRRILAAAVAAAAAGCVRKPRTSPKARVLICRASGYDADLADSIRRILTEHRVYVRGKRVLLKPNLVEYDSGAPINTHPALVEAVLDALLSGGAAAVYIAEGPANRPDAFEVAESAGYFAIPEFERRFTDLNYDDVVAVPMPHAGHRLPNLYVARAAFAYDALISLPKLKTHHWAGVTLSLKNLFGFVPGSVYGWPKNALHWAGIDACVASLHAAIPVHFTIVDGIAGMEGNGPLQGTSKAAGVLIAGADAVSVDATCCRVMNIDPQRIGYLVLTGRPLAETSIEQIGERVQDVLLDFELPPGFARLRPVAG